MFELTQAPQTYDGANAALKRIHEAYHARVAVPIGGRFCMLMHCGEFIWLPIREAFLRHSTSVFSTDRSKD